MDLGHTRRFEPVADGLRSFCWATGRFDTAGRRYTELVEGTIRTPDDLILVTLRGGAERSEISTDCGHRYSGPERGGAVSFVPANCERKLRMRGVFSQWASITLPPGLAGEGEEPAIAPFSNVDDPFVAGLVGDFERRHAADGTLDPLYCEIMSRALACYLVRRYGDGARTGPRGFRLPAWRLRRVADYVEAHLAEPILVGDLATVVDLSAGHLHRAFRASFGMTPVEYVNDRRVQRAVAILADEEVPIGELAARVGFASPSHFTRVFRRLMGVTPSRYRSGG